MAGPVQQPPQQYAPQPPMAAAEPPKGMATAALVLGIVGLVLSIIPWCTWVIGVPCDILAIIFGAVTISKVRSGEATGEGMAKAGLVCGIVGILAVIMWVVIGMFILGSVSYYDWGSSDGWGY